MEYALVLFLTGMVVWILYNYTIHTSTVILVGVLLVTIYMTLYPGFEQFQENPDDLLNTIEPKTLQLAGISRPSVYNCVNKIGDSVENNIFAANLTDVWVFR
jgi:hypothetical protein